MVGLRYYEADFGWGKPVWLSIGSVSLPNAALLSDTSDGEGVEASVIYTRKTWTNLKKILASWLMLPLILAYL